MKGSRANFPTTQWTLVFELGAQEPTRRKALDELCQLYWYPIYGQLRARGKSPADAEDLTQGFFAHLLSGDGFARADAARGRLRNFLLGALNRFLVAEHRRSSAQKRGGGKVIISMDANDAESWLSSDFVDGTNPEKVFDQRWAQTVLNGVRTTLQREYEARGRSDHYTALQNYLFWNADEAPYREVAERIGLSEAAVRQAVVRMRKRYGELLREYVAFTVEDEADIDQEIRDLFEAFRPSG